MYSKLTLITPLFTAALLLSCFDKIESTPPCFLDGSEMLTVSDEVAVNVCCDPTQEGDQFCQDYFKEEGYGSLSALSQCTEKGYCRLCELGASCSCLGQRDCGEGGACELVDEPSLCEQSLSGFEGQRCALCI